MPSLRELARETALLIPGIVIADLIADAIKSGLVTLALKHLFS